MTTKNTNAKEIVKTKVIADKKTKVNKKENDKIDNATLQAITKERPTTVKEKNYLYKFERLNLTDKQQKKERNKLRRNLKLLTNKIILLNLKKKDFTECQTFINFYKENYILNDFTIKSLSNVSNEETIKDYELVLNLCKESLTK